MRDWELNQSRMHAQPSNRRFVKPINNEPVFQVFEPVRPPYSGVLDIMYALAAALIALSIVLTLWK